jgi:hypothetical protein
MVASHTTQWDDTLICFWKYRLGLYQYIINVGFDISPNLSFQYDVYALLICDPSIL